MKISKLLLLMVILAGFVFLLNQWRSQFRLRRAPVFRHEQVEQDSLAIEWANPFLRVPADTLLRRLTSDDPQVKIKAARALGYLQDPRAVTPLLSLLNDKDPEVVAAGLFALAKLKAKQALEPSIKLLKHPNPRVRSMAAFTLGELGDKRAIDPLNEALGDRDAATRYLVKRALEKLLVLYKVRMLSQSSEICP